MNEQEAINIALKSPVFNDAMKEVIRKKLDEVAELFLRQYEKTIEDMFKKRASRIIQYVSFTSAEIAKKGIKALGEEDYHFAFTITSAKGEENYVFYRVQIKEEKDANVEAKKTIKIKKPTT